MFYHEYFRYDIDRYMWQVREVIDGQSHSQAVGICGGEGPGKRIRFVYTSLGEELDIRINSFRAQENKRPRFLIKYQGN